MSEHSEIEWTDATWNPVRGCTKISPGCAHCYAETFAERFRGVPGHPYEQGFDLRLVPEKLAEPLKWKKPKLVFVNSMSDLFHPDVPPEYIEHIFGVMAYCEQHTFQVLTKRPKAMLAWFERWLGAYDFPLTACLDRAGLAPGGPRHWPLPNVWLGVSAENQKTADSRIPELLRCPAAVRWVSYEPALGPVDFRNWLKQPWMPDHIVRPISVPVEYIPVVGMDWLVCGGESGPGARPMHPDWARSARDQCQAAGVSFFFKQWGNHSPDPRMFETKTQWINKASTWVNGGTCIDQAGKILRNGADFDAAEYPVAILHRVGKKAAGRLLDGRTWDQIPERRAAPCGSKS